MLLRHPIGLYILFFVEMWERFGFYCMLAIFKLYMVDPEHPYDILRANSNQIYGLYLGGTYFTPFFGGILADWKLGYRLSVTLGAVFFVAGYFMLGAKGLPFFFAGLTLLVIGNGLFKPNISTMVGKLYPQGDARVDSAFTIFYMGINIGAFLSPIVAGAVASRYGYCLLYTSDAAD
ncbi:MAG: oligopeptide:H+ symporter, partial [Gemmataceae bacterium]|nr:oligopeptide:H+ symporter [Gemmataceae bacterium]